MKKIDSSKLDKIKKLHFEYCKKLRPNGGKSLPDDQVYYLCCENPFDFSNSVEPLKQQYLTYKQGNIDYCSAYKKFRSEQANWSGIELLKILEVNVCPYCGINYFSTVTKKCGKKFNVATFDHYLPKSEYKFLALNIYNLIPSCKNCNSTFKNSNDKLVLNPFFHSLEDEIEFYIKDESVINELINNKSKIDIEIRYDAKNKLLRQHNEVLLLQERYNYFTSIARSIILKKQAYESSRIRELASLINLDDNQIKEMLIKQDVFNEDEPFLKFKKDIWKQLGYL